jgi:3-oxoacyl-[acyl-carrier protein] reductase
MAIKGLAGRRALVTGAASGIGQAVLARLKREGVDAFGADIHPYDGLLHCDLTDSREVENLAGRIGGVPSPGRGER